MNRQKQHKNRSNKRRDNNLLASRFSAFVVAVYFSGLFFITPMVFAAAAPTEIYDANKPDVKSIASFIPQDYRYSSAGRTDPFLSYLIKRDELIKNLEEQRRKEVDVLNTLRSMQEVRTELQRFDITQLTLSSIISASNEVWAMVIDPAGAGYVIKKDSLIGKNGGVVDQIIRKIENTEYGSKYIRKVIIKEPYISKEGSIEYKIVEMNLINPYYD